MHRPAYQLVFLSNKQLYNYPVKSSQVKKLYWHKFIHFYNNHGVTETQLGLFVTTKYMTYLSNEKDLFLTKQVSRVQNKTVPHYWYLRKYEQMK